MKRFRYILYIVLVAVLCGCVREQFEEQQGQQEIQLKDGDPVTINGSIELPMVNDGMWGTKAFTETPQVKALYIAVFNSGDILYEVVKANPGTYSHPQSSFTPATEGEKYLTYFNVTLSAVIQGDRYVHFIACSEEIPSLEGGGTNMVDEGTFIRGLETTGAVVAYWNRQHYTFITADTPMKNLPMVRNFAKVKVTVDASNFTLLGFKVFNTPKYGTITPFNNNTSDYIIENGETRINFNRFAKYEELYNPSTFAAIASPYTYMTDTQRYYGYMPVSVEYDDLTSLSPGYSSDGSTDAAFVSANFIGYSGGAHESENADYLYECSYRADNNPFIILYGTYNGNNYFYKADFVYYNSDIAGNQYYNILRDFQYTLNITSVSGKGSDTIYDAFNSVAFNNFDASTESQALTNIANDNSRLYVSKTDILITSGTSFKMYVKSGTGTNYATDDNASITALVRDATSGSKIVSAASNISIASSNVTSGTWAGWREVTITCADTSTLSPGEVWKQPIVFKNGDGLTRVVSLTLRRPMSLTVDVQDYVAGTAETECWVDFSIPAGLTIARFPMYFYIEQEDNTLYPKALAAGDRAALSVMSGESNIPGNTGNNYYYRRTITWDEYTDSAHQADIYGIKTFRSLFKSLVGASATTVWVFPAPENDYYYPVDGSDYTNQDSFANSMITGAITFERSGVQLNVGGTVSNVGTANSGAPVSYSSSNTSVATVSASGVVTAIAAGKATITATCAAYKNYTAASNTFPVEVTASALSGLTVFWQAEPVYVIPVGSTGTTLGQYSVVSGYNGTVTASYSSSNTGIASVNTSTGVVSGVSSGTAVITYTATASGGSYASATQSISYTVHVGTPASGTVYHEETFLGDGGYSVATNGADHWNGYSIETEVVTDGATYSAGSSVLTDFLTYTTYNAGTGYPTRHVWYNYYNYSTSSGFGMAASGYGATVPATFVDDPAPGHWDYHNQSYATHATLVSKTINLSSSAGAKLTFYHAGNYFNASMQDDVHVRFSSDGGSTWSDPVSINYPDGNNWVYVKAQAEIPAAYRTANFKLMFDYSSTSSRAGTWEIKNLTITEN